MNRQTQKLHRQLIKTHQNLSKRLGATRDRDEAESVLREMEELNFRIMMAGRLLFKETTASIDERIGGVVEASTDLNQAIAEIEKVRDVVKAIGKFLTIADKALDAIKVL